MWRFCTGPGAKPPPKKKTKTVDDKLATQRVYDKTKRQRKFQEVWKHGRPWLECQTCPITGNQFMICTVCTEASKTDSSVDTKNTFTLGCDSFKLESVKLHENSNNHLKAKRILQSIRNPSLCPAFKIVCNLRQKDYDKLSILFRNCHSLAMKNRPFSDFVWMCELDQAKGLHTGKTYLNEQSAKEFTKYIANTERQKLADHVRNAKFISILSDGSTDSSVQEQEMFYIRYVDGGVPHVKFMAAVHVDKPDAISIFEGLKRAVTQYLNVPWVVIVNKLVSLGCDGASVMTGRKGGLGALLQKDSPSLTVIHCLAHRLELGFKDVSKSKSGQIHEKLVDTLLLGLYYFYHRSAVNRACLKQCAKALQCRLLMPSRVGGTRWVGHIHKALNNMLESYSAIMLHLQQVH